MLRWLVFAGRVALGGVLLYAGYVKLQMPWINFAAQIQAYKLSWLTDEAVIFIARTLPWFEVVLGGLLWLGLGVRWLAGLASALLLFFFVILVRSFALGMDIDCGCFGEGDRLTWKTLVRDGLLLASSIAVTWGAHLLVRRQRAAPLPAAQASSAQSSAD
jgi:uncharacterized membrane protein YphA (DoxX/SURF4 family)